MQQELPGMPPLPLEWVHVGLHWDVMGRVDCSVAVRRHGCEEWGTAGAFDLPPGSQDELLTAIDGCVAAAMRRSSPGCQDPV